MFRFLLVLLTIAVVAHGYRAGRPLNLKHIRSRIVGGANANIANYPYQVRLFPTDDTDTYLCGGSILNNNYVLTAAHCLADGIKSVSVTIGTSNLWSGGKSYTTTKFKMHPSYNANTKDYDIAYLDMRSTPMAIDGKTSKATKLPSAGASIPTNTTVTITGWGATSEGGSISEILQVVKVRTVSNTQCKASYGTITSRMICAAVPEGGKDSCQGDSGGPLVRSSDQVQFGVVSFGIGCARPGIPGVYSNVAALRSWIQQNTGV